MPITVVCPSCSARIKAPDSAAGRRSKCPKCQGPITVPAVESPPAPTLQARAVARSAAVAPPSPPRSWPEEKVYAEHEVEVIEEPELVDADEPAEKAPAKRPARGLPPDADFFEGQDVPEGYQETIVNELSKGERVVWFGRPSMEVRLHKARHAPVAGAAFAGLGLVFAVVLCVAVGSTGAVIAGLVVGVVFVAAGVLFSFMRPLLRKFARHRECYVLTNRRALIFHVRLTGTYTGPQLLKMEREEFSHPKGSGDLIFEYELVERGAGGPPRGGSIPRHQGLEKEPKGFLAIDNVRAVERLIRETLLDRMVDKAVAH